MIGDTEYRLIRAGFCLMAAMYAVIFLTGPLIELWKFIAG